MKYISLLALSALALTGCGGSSSDEIQGMQPAEQGALVAGKKAVTLNFAAQSFGERFTCEQAQSGFGRDGTDSVGLADLRFFVSGIEFYDNNGDTIDFSLAENEFQYVSEEGDVALIDLTSNTQGSCADGAIAFGEGTSRENTQITGEIDDTPVAGVRFNTGVPQAVMKEVIANHSTEDAPSPLGELFWSWASGYRHFVMNFSTTNAADETGEGYIHLGSRGCGADSPRALSDKDSCDLVNTPTVNLEGFNPDTNTLIVNIDQVLSGLDFVTPVLSTEEPIEVIGQAPGVSCHSAPIERQPDCDAIFQNFGLDITTGSSDATKNDVFTYE